MAGRVLHLAAGNLYGGVETFLVTLARAPRRLEHRFALFFEGRLASELRDAGAEVEVLGPARLGRPWTLVRPQLRLRRLLASWRPDLVLNHSSWTKAAAGPALLGQRQALFLHNPLEPRFALDRLLTWWPPDALLSNTAFTAESATLLPGLEPLVVRYPVEDRVPRDPEVRRAVRQELGVAEATRVILQVSRLEEWKGHALLVEALARLPHAEDWVCWMAGGAQRPEEQDYLARLKARVDTLGLSDRVRFLGQRSDVPRLLAAADIFCQPNLGPEPFGIVFVEAMYAGLPVLTTDMGGAREVVEERWGTRVPPQADAVAEVLARWLSEPEARQDLGRAGREHARSLYLPSIRVPLLEDALERAMRP